MKEYFGHLPPESCLTEGNARSNLQQNGDELIDFGINRMTHPASNTQSSNIKHIIQWYTRLCKHIIFGRVMNPLRDLRWPDPCTAASWGMEQHQSMHWPQLYKHISWLHQMSLIFCFKTRIALVPFCFQCFFAWKQSGGLRLFTKPGKFRVAGGNFCNYWATRSGFEANKFASICRDVFLNLSHCHVSWHRLSTCCCVFGCL